MKDMYLNSRKLMGGWNASSKKKGRSNILGSNMLSDVASVPNITGLSFKQAMGIKTKMRGGPSQKQYLRSVKRKPTADRMISYFTDTDGDLVPNALDCFSMDSRKHGFITKLRNAVTGQGWREDKQVSGAARTAMEQKAERGEAVRNVQSQIIEQERQKQFDELERKEKMHEDVERYNKQVTEREQPEDLRAEAWQNRIDREKSKAQYERPGESLEEIKRKENMRKAAEKRYKKEIDEADKSIDEYEDYKKSPEFKLGSNKDDELFKKMQKEIGEEKVAKDKLKQASQWQGERTKEFKENIQKSKAQHKRPEKVVEEKVEPDTLWGTVAQNVGKKFSKKVYDVRSGASRMTGYLFEKEDVAEAMKERESARLKQRAEKAGLDPKKLRKLEERRRGYKEIQVPIKDKSGRITGYNSEKVPISSADRMTTDTFKELVGSQISGKQKEKAKLRGLESLEKKELMMRGLDAARKAEFSKLNIQRTRMERQRLSQAQGGFGFGSSGQNAMSGSTFGGTSWPYSESNSFYGQSTSSARETQMTNVSNILPGYIPKPSSGRFDSSAPKFTYKKDVKSFTRKTSRVKKGDKLQIGKSSMPSTKKRAGSAFPWTKPMKGWSRVYEGSGRTVGRGKKKKSNAGIKSFYTQVKPKKMSFQPYVSTYELKGITPKGKKMRML